MKIAISSTGPDLDSQIDPRFGRCPFLLIVDTETEAIDVLENSAAASSDGAGIQTAQMIVNVGVGTVLTGNLGPNATQVLNTAGLKVHLGAAGTAREALARLSQDTSQAAATSRPASPGSSPALPTGGIGMGQGCGRGIGMGRGCGGGRGMGGGRRRNSVSGRF